VPVPEGRPRRSGVSDRRGTSRHVGHWLGLSIARRQAGGELSLLGARHAARLRGAIIGKDKSDVIDADVLATAGEVFTLTPLRPPTPSDLALRRAVTRRGKLVIDGNRARRRLISLARWAFPDPRVAGPTRPPIP